MLKPPLVRETSCITSGDAKQSKNCIFSTTLPSVVAYKKAAQAQVPVHWSDPQKSGETMHKLMWELIPALRGKCAPGFSCGK